MSENIEVLIDKHHKETILYLEENGFYEDIDYSKQASNTTYVRQFSILNQEVPIRVSINTSLGFSVSILSLVKISRNKRILSIVDYKKPKSLQIRKDNIPFLKSFIEAYLIHINNSYILDYVSRQNLASIIFSRDDGGYNSSFASYVYIGLYGSREYRKLTSAKLDLMSTEFPKQIYDYCIKHSLNIPEKLKKMFA